jgi:hypothetical protein
MMYPFEITEFLGCVPLHTYQCVAHVVRVTTKAGERTGGWRTGEITIVGENGEMTVLPELHQLYNLAIVQLSAQARRIDAEWANRHDEHELAGEAV